MDNLVVTAAIPLVSSTLKQTARYGRETGSTNKADALRWRLETFSKWSCRKDAMQLATAGFIYTGVGDKVECQSCGIRLYNWQDDENPLEAHKKYAPDCEFMSKNFPNIQAPAKPKKILSVKYPQYSDYQARLKSFDSWPLKCVVQKPEIMARSGFFYIGSADRARCFYCGVTLRDWDTDDYPPCVHKQWSSNCPFIQELDVDGIQKEIKQLERMKKAKNHERNSVFFNCSFSSKRQTIDADVVTNGFYKTALATHSHSQVSSLSTDGVSTSTVQSQISDLSTDGTSATQVHSQVSDLSTDGVSTSTVQSQISDLSTDGTSATQVHSQVSDLSTDGLAFSPAIQAVAEMGYGYDVVEKALEKRRKEGLTNPNAVSLFEAIMDMDI